MNTLPIRMNLEEESYRKLADGLAVKIRVCMPGVIQEWDPDRQVAVIQPAIQERVNINGNLSWTSIPLLVDVPLMTIRGGGHLIVTAIKPGDECLIFFADMCIDSAWQSGGVDNIQMDKRRHDLSDACFIPSLFSQPKRISNYPAEGIQLRNDSGSTVVEVVHPNINITAAGNVTIQGRDFLSHQHSGVQSGDSNTGGVV